MKVTLTNQSAGSVPLVLGNSGGEALAILLPGESRDINDDAIVVVSVGDNPSFIEEVLEAVGNIGETLARLAWWREHHPRVAEAESVVRVGIVNSGTAPLRILSDSNTNESFIAAESAGQAEATRYVEIRQQGV